MPNWYTDDVCIPAQERLDKISVLCQDKPEVQRLIHEITTILDSAGTDQPDGEVSND